MPMNNVQSPSYSCPDITSLVNNEWRECISSANTV
jgi:hypothetical protein